MTLVLFVVPYNNVCISVPIWGGDKKSSAIQLCWFLCARKIFHRWKETSIQGMVYFTAIKIWEKIGGIQMQIERTKNTLAAKDTTFYSLFDKYLMNKILLVWIQFLYYLCISGRWVVFQFCGGSETAERHIHLQNHR